MKQHLRRWVGSGLGVGVCMVQLGSGLGAVYYVATNGLDSAAGTAAAPWRTISRAASATRAGDVVVVGPGEYREYVHETDSGTADSYITYRGVPAHTASVWAFRISGAFVRLEGLKFTGYSGVSNTWGAAVRIEPGAHGTVITNCWISDAPYVVAHDVQYNAEESAVISESSDFIRAGFMPGSKVYLGASGLDGLWFTNHDTVWTVASNTPTKMWLTNATSGGLQTDYGSNYWTVFRPGGAGLYGILCVRSGGRGANGVRIAGNVFSNWMGAAMSVTSHGARIENNVATRLQSFPFLYFDGSDIVIRSNIVRHCTNLLYYSPSELAALIHPEGTGWYDYQVAMIRGESSNGLQSRTNGLVEWNWFEHIDNQLGRVDDQQAETWGIVYRNNVFVGVSMHFSGGRDGMQWISNTFYRCAFDAGHPLALGGRPPTQTNYVIKHNLFIECGSMDRQDLVGWYGVSSNANGVIADWNMVAGPEVRGWPGKQGFAEEHGVNGGDPGFRNPEDPDGPDDIPFTEDDGLKVVPGSLGASVGGGALGVVGGEEAALVARLRLLAPLGWHEPLGTNYNPVWWATPPTRRGGPVRPYRTPPSLGKVPVSVVLEAEVFEGAEQVAGEDGSFLFHWDFGDGTRFAGTSRVATYKYTRPGCYRIRLTVVAPDGRQDTHSRTLCVGGQWYELQGQGVPRAPASLRIVDDGGLQGM